MTDQENGDWDRMSARVKAGEQHDPNEAFHQHLHEVIQKARSEADTQPPHKSLVRIKRADFLVGYYPGGVELKDTVECDSMDEAEQVVKEMGADMCRIFVAYDLFPKG